MKIVVRESESDALLAWIDGLDGELVSSDFTRTELVGAVRRVEGSRVARARQFLDSIALIWLTTATFDSASRLEPVTPRSLNAVHLASALELGDDLDGIVTYDDRMADAAHALGVAVVAPSGIAT